MSQVHLYPCHHRRHGFDEIGIGRLAECRVDCTEVRPPQLGKLMRPRSGPGYFIGESAMTITNMPIEEYAEPERVVRPAKDGGNGGFKPLKLTATLKRRALKRNLKSQKPRADRGAVVSGTESDV